MVRNPALSCRSVQSDRVHPPGPSLPCQRQCAGWRKPQKGAPDGMASTHGSRTLVQGSIHMRIQDVTSGAALPSFVELVRARIEMPVHPARTRLLRHGGELGAALGRPLLGRFRTPFVQAICALAGTEDSSLRNRRFSTTTRSARPHRGLPKVVSGPRNLAFFSVAAW